MMLRFTCSSTVASFPPKTITADAAVHAAEEYARSFSNQGMDHLFPIQVSVRNMGSGETRAYRVERVVVPKFNAIYLG